MPPTLTSVLSRWAAAQHKINKPKHCSGKSQIAMVQANLSRPGDPPVASDWQSADARHVTGGSGSVESQAGTGPHSKTNIPEPATKGTTEDMTKIGRQGGGILKERQRMVLANGIKCP
jgi:hypothetical protein